MFSGFPGSLSDLNSTLSQFSNTVGSLSLDVLQSIEGNESGPQPDNSNNSKNATDLSSNTVRNEATEVQKVEKSIAAERSSSAKPSPCLASAEVQTDPIADIETFAVNKEVNHDKSSGSNNNTGGVSDESIEAAVAAAVHKKDQEILDLSAKLTASKDDSTKRDAVISQLQAQMKALEQNNARMTQEYERRINELQNECAKLSQESTNNSQLLNIQETNEKNLAEKESLLQNILQEQEKATKEKDSIIEGLQSKIGVLTDKLRELMTKYSELKQKNNVIEESIVAKGEESVNKDKVLQSKESELIKVFSVIIVAVCHL